MSDLRRIKTVFAVLTASCNLTCGYCFQNRKQDRRMSVETLRKTVDLLLDSHEPRLQLVFFGGEPLLEFDLLREGATHALARRREDQELRLAVITNGTLLRADRLDFLVEHDFGIQLSFDGVPRAQDLRGKGTFAVLGQVLETLAARHPEYYEHRFRVNVTLLPATVPHLADSVAYFLERVVPEIAVTPTMTNSARWREEDISVLEAQYRRILDLSLEEYRRTGRIPMVDLRNGDANPGRPDWLTMCGVVSGEAPTVDVDGSVHGCATFSGSFQSVSNSFLREQLGAMEIGKLEHPDLPARYREYEKNSARASIFHDKQDKYSSYARCGECSFLAECHVCPMAIGHMPGNRDPRRVPDFPCAFNLVSLRCRDEFQASLPGAARAVRRTSPLRARVRALAEALDGR